MATIGLSPAARAFDSIADQFDARFGEWLSVAAQRRAIRDALSKAFPRGSRLLELGGGTGEDALWLAERDREVLMTDPSPRMVEAADRKSAGRFRTAIAAAEQLEKIAQEPAADGGFDGAYSVFAGLNCVADLDSVALGLARLVRPGGSVVLVLFGTFSLGEMLVETLRGRPDRALRRLARGDVEARLNGQRFTVRYHRKRDLVRSMRPWFDLADDQGIGLFVPPSAAEPWISRHARLLNALEAADRLLAKPLSGFADHRLYRFVRTPC